jgi:hypothetical protein
VAEKTLSLTNAQNNIATALGTDTYVLAPAWYGTKGQANFLPPEITHYVVNGLISAFAGGLVATLKPATILLGRTVGVWVTGHIQKLLGSETRLHEVSDESVDKTIKELRNAAEKDGLIEKHSDEIQQSLASTLEENGITPDHASEIVQTVRDQIVQLIS